jgi:hypothetical protein
VAAAERERQRGIRAQLTQARKIERHQPMALGERHATTVQRKSSPRRSTPWIGNVTSMTSMASWPIGWRS